MQALESLLAGVRLELRHACVPRVAGLKMVGSLDYATENLASQQNVHTIGDAVDQDGLERHGREQLLRHRQAGQSLGGVLGVVVVDWDGSPESLCAAGKTSG